MIRIVLGLALILQLALLAPTAAQAQSKEKMKTQEAAAFMIPGTAGRGELALTSSAAVTYQEYFAHECPLVLVVEDAGWATHAALGSAGNCPEKGRAIPQATIRSTLNACNTYAANRPCSVIAVGRQMVWRGPIVLLPGPFIPRGNTQLSIVLRKPVGEDDLSTSYETAVGLVDYNGTGGSGEVIFQRHDELGMCHGSVTASGDSMPVSLDCTKVGTITGTLSIDPEKHAGSGMVTGANGSQFMLTVLPRADFMENGTAIYTPPPEPDQTMMKQESGA